LTDKFFQVPTEISTTSGLVSLSFVQEIVLFCFEKCGVMLDRLRGFYPRLALDGIEDVVDGEPQRGKVLLCSVGSERILRKNRECLFLEGGLPPVLIARLFSWDHCCYRRGFLRKDWVGISTPRGGE